MCCAHFKCLLLLLQLKGRKLFSNSKNSNNDLGLLKTIEKHIKNQNLSFLCFRKQIIFVELTVKGESRILAAVKVLEFDCRQFI